jgi:MoaA/NifB/PqqE/SkfB family radical SAM enzyme
MSNKKLSIKEDNGIYSLTENGNLVPCSFTPNFPVGQDTFGRVIMQPSKMCSTQCLHAEYKKEGKLYCISCGTGLKFIVDEAAKPSPLKIIGSNE